MQRDSNYRPTSLVLLECPNSNLGTSRCRQSVSHRRETGVSKDRIYGWKAKYGGDERGAGIGRGIALKLAKEGTRVAIHYYRDREAAEATLDKICELGSNGFLIQADVCHPEEVCRIFQQVRSEFRLLDIFSLATSEEKLRRSTRHPWMLRLLRACAPSRRVPPICFASVASRGLR